MDELPLEFFKLFEDDCLTNLKAKLSSEKSNVKSNRGKYTAVNDCEIWTQLTKKMNCAYELVAYPERKNKLFCPSDSEIAFLNKTVFPVLLPALSRTLQLAKLSNSVQFQRRSFNGIDAIVEYLWNNNPNHPVRKKRSLFKIPFVKKYLKRRPRKAYSKICFFNEEEAATVIQAHLKGFLVRSRPDVMEMRLFWKTMRQEREVAENNEKFHKNKKVLEIQSENEEDKPKRKLTFDDT